MAAATKGTSHSPLSFSPLFLSVFYRSSLVPCFFDSLSPRAFVENKFDRLESPLSCTLFNRDANQLSWPEASLDS
jgi:hypothetical protein